MAYSVGAGIEYHDEPIALCHGGGYALFQSVIVFFADHHLVYHHFDVVVFVAVELHAMHHFANFAVDTYIQISFLADLLEQLLVVALTGSYQWSQQVDSLAQVFFAYEAQNLFLGIFNHLLAR